MIVMALFIFEFDELDEPLLELTIDNRLLTVWTISPEEFASDVLDILSSKEKVLFTVSSLLICFTDVI